MRTRIESIFRVLGFVSVLCFLWPCATGVCAPAEAVSSSVLIHAAKEMDGTTVLFEGEVIGDIMRRGTYAWVNIHDGINAIGCWMPFAMAQTIAYTGNYKTKGDWVAVSGEFHRACPMHGGDLDIHAHGLKIVRGGQVVIEQSDTAKKNTVFVLTGVVCLVLILMRFKQA
ncbi:MAG TPA: DNA-binding protein [Candidatus Omnitrophota bacterium]|nr:DNA-binding protein [Candidatus Omnitrophota bacterium]HPT07169.1 DNA-binding protein [Candidatus Omnitrophota bacterium]